MEIMKVAETKLDGVLIIEPDVFADDRGYFLETFNARRYREQCGIDVTFVQDNFSHSKQGVLRGLHFQRAHPQAKLVSVATGEVWDVIVDIDPRSPTFRQYVGVHLSAERKTQVYVPAGYAHGFCVLSETADFVYKCSDFYRPGDEGGIAWNDPALGIAWPVAEPVLSEKDARNPMLAEALDEAAQDNE